jgi:hypothetical protein
LNIPQGTRQYWQGQWDALTQCARVLRNFADRNPTSQQLRRLATAIETKACLLAAKKLGEDSDG